MNIQIFYRISDKEKAKCKLPGANKIRCLNNCLDVFKNNITIIADNCSELLLNDLKNKNLKKKYDEEVALINSMSDDDIVDLFSETFK